MRRATNGADIGHRRMSSLRFHGATVRWSGLLLLIVFVAAGQCAHSPTAAIDGAVGENASAMRDGAAATEATAAATHAQQLRRGTFDEPDGEDYSEAAEAVGQLSLSINGLISYTTHYITVNNYR